MRGQPMVGLPLWNIPRNHGGIAYPPNPRRSFGRNIQREMPGVPYIRAGAYAPLHGFAQSANPPSDAGSLALIYDKASRSISARFAGMYPANCPPIRSRPTPALAAAPRVLLVSIIVS